MTDLSVEERAVMEKLGEAFTHHEWGLLKRAGRPDLDGKEQGFEAGWRARREYSKQREEKLRAGVRELIEAHDAWSVNSYPSDGGTAIAARAWFDEAQRVEGAVENLRAALAENGDTDV